MKKQFLGLMLSAAVCALCPVHAMEKDDSIPQAISQNKIILQIPEKFPGHNTRPIQGTVKVPDDFDPQDYQQDRSRNEGACGFNSLLAGIMHTEYGRAKVQAILESQDDTHVNIQFYFPNYKTVKEFESNIYSQRVENVKKSILEFQLSLEFEENEEEIEYMNESIKKYSETLETFPMRWEKSLRVSDTMVKVPKYFATREGTPGSFPHKNPDWLNLTQQAYFMAQKNCMSGRNWLFSSQHIKKNDFFWGISFYILQQDEYNYISCVDIPKFLNRVGDKGLGYGKEIKCFPLIDIPLKDLKFYPHRENGIDLENIVDLQATLQDEQFVYTPLKYETITEFVHRNGLSKDLLMANNVVQIGAAGHAVALFFGEGKVHYYDNVYYPEQVSVYGKVGPIYEEAKHFEGLSINTMEEEEFFTRFFKEINHRREQVAQVRGEKALFELDDYGNRYKAILTFFERPLVNQK